MPIHYNNFIIQRISIEAQAIMKKSGRNRLNTILPLFFYLHSLNVSQYKFLGTMKMPLEWVL
jgi:hypothetical protein